MLQLELLLLISYIFLSCTIYLDSALFYFLQLVLLVLHLHPSQFSVNLQKKCARNTKMKICGKYERNISYREGKANIFGICAGCCTNGNTLELNGEIMELQESKQRMMRGTNWEIVVNPFLPGHNCFCDLSRQIEL